jgi:serine protease Do
MPLGAGSRQANVWTMMSTGTKISLLGVVTAALAFSEATGESVKTATECGWIGVGVSPVSAVMAESLGMDVPYGAIFDFPEPDSPAAAAKIEAGDLITAINDTPLMNAKDFVPTIAAMAPGTMVYLRIRRNGQLREINLILGSGKCPTIQ